MGPAALRYCRLAQRSSPGCGSLVNEEEETAPSRSSISQRKGNQATAALSDCPPHFPCCVFGDCRFGPMVFVCHSLPVSGQFVCVPVLVELLGRSQVEDMSDAELAKFGPMVLLGVLLGERPPLVEGQSHTDFVHASLWNRHHVLIREALIVPLLGLRHLEWHNKHVQAFDLCHSADSGVCHHSFTPAMHAMSQRAHQIHRPLDGAAV